MSTPADAPIAGLAPLLRQLVDLKRIRAARHRGSLTEEAFARSWAALVEGTATEALALRETAAALTATRLAGLDGAVLTEHGLGRSAAQSVLRKALRAAAAPVDDALAERLEAALEVAPDAAADPPPFVRALAAQPRAGVTAPGQPRLVLTPTESHADHSMAVALLGVLLAPVFAADPARVFVVGLAHHLMNATLPDAGHAGDVLLGEYGAALRAAATERALAQLALPLRRTAEDALDTTRRLDTPEAEAFHAADALDRVLEIKWHARTAAFTMDTAMEEMDLVHEGFTQPFQQDVLRRAGITNEQ